VVVPAATTFAVNVAPWPTQIVTGVTVAAGIAYAVMAPEFAELLHPSLFFTVTV
jgi:hypothetical protein